MHFLGADESLVHAHVLSWAWFRPSEDAWEDGARWYRCDVVGGGDQSGATSTCRQTAKGLLLGRPTTSWMVCADGRAWSGSVKVPCTEGTTGARSPRSSSAEPDDAYPGDRLVEVTTRDFCSDSVGAWLNYPVDYDFGYTWFHEAEWEAGNRRSVCWAKTERLRRSPPRRCACARGLLVGCRRLLRADAGAAGRPGGRRGDRDAVAQRRRAAPAEGGAATSSATRTPGAHQRAAARRLSRGEHTSVDLRGRPARHRRRRPPAGGRLQRVQAQVAEPARRRWRDFVGGSERRSGSACCARCGSPRRSRSPTRARTGTAATSSPSPATRSSRSTATGRGRARHRRRPRPLRHVRHRRPGQRGLRAVICARPTLLAGDRGASPSRPTSYPGVGPPGARRPGAVRGRRPRAPTTRWTTSGATSGRPRPSGTPARRTGCAGRLTGARSRACAAAGGRAASPWRS